MIYANFTFIKINNLLICARTNQNERKIKNARHGVLFFVIHVFLSKEYSVTEGYLQGLNTCAVLNS